MKILKVAELQKLYADVTDHSALCRAGQDWAPDSFRSPLAQKLVLDSTTYHMQFPELVPCQLFQGSQDFAISCGKAFEYAAGDFSV